MKYWILLSTWLTAAILAMPQLAAAQAIKLHKKTTAQGEIDRTPYITYAEFEATSLGTSGKGKTTGSTSARGVTLGDLVSVSSLDDVTRLLGEPKSVNRGSPYGRNVLAYIDYEGMELEYVNWNKDDPDSEFELRELHLKSSDWSFTVDGTELRPGMSVDQLSPVVRQTLDEDFGQSVDAFGAVVIAKPGTAKQTKRGGELKGMKGGATIQIEVNGGTVDVVRFHREI